MPANRYQKLRIEIFPFAQAFRVGDQLRVTLDAPGGARPLWAFDTLDHGQRVSVANDKQHPSLLALTAVPARRAEGTSLVLVVALQAVPGLHALSGSARPHGAATRRGQRMADSPDTTRSGHVEQRWSSPGRASSPRGVPPR